MVHFGNFTGLGSPEDGARGGKAGPSGAQRPRITVKSRVLRLWETSLNSGAGERHTEAGLALPPTTSPPASHLRLFSPALRL